MECSSIVNGSHLRAVLLGKFGISASPESAASFATGSCTCHTLLLMSSLHG